jgi:F420-dependent oxidoreductase-like protein
MEQLQRSSAAFAREADGSGGPGVSEQAHQQQAYPQQAYQQRAGRRPSERDARAATDGAAVTATKGASMRVSLLHFISWGVVPPSPIVPPPGTSPVEDYIEQLRRARADGFDTMWTPQLWREPDLLTLLALALHEVDGITVGTGVIPIQFRHPAVLAQQALTVNLISGGRLKLGIGMTHPMICEGMYGIPWERHVRRLNEYLDGLLPLLEAEEARATGEITSTRLAIDMPGAPAPEVYVAALGPKLLEITGRRTAGTITWMTGPRTVENHVLPTLARAAEGRDQRPEVVAGFPICVTDEPEAARELAAEIFEIYGQQPSYRAMLDREGYERPEDFAIIGDERAVRERLDELDGLGVDELSAFVFARTAEDDTRTRRLLGSLARAGRADAVASATG